MIVRTRSMRQTAEGKNEKKWLRIKLTITASSAATQEKTSKPSPGYWLSVDGDGSELHSEESQQTHHHEYCSSSSSSIAVVVVVVVVVVV